MEQIAKNEENCTKYLALSAVVLTKAGNNKASNKLFVFF